MKTFLRTFPALLLFAAGCMTVGPDFSPPTFPTPESIGGAADSSDITVWWNKFDDAVLSNLVEIAIKNSPTIESASARLRASREMLTASERRRLPQFSGGASFSESRRSGGEVAESSWSDSISGSLDARWEIDIFGGVRRQIEATSAETRALAYTLEDARVSLAAEVAGAYFNLRRLEESLALSRANVEILERSCAIAKARVEANSAPRSELFSAEAQLASLRASLPTIAAELSAQKLRIDCLLGGIPGQFAEIYGAENSAPASLPSLPTILPNDLLRRRADVRIAEENVRGKNAAIGVAIANTLPKFTLGGSIGVSAPDFTPWGDYVKAISAGPSISWNIFGFGYYRRQIKAARATLDAALADYRATVLAAYEETEKARENLICEEQRTELLALAQEKSAASLDIAQRLYEAGSAEYTEVLAAQQSLISARNALVAHKYALFSNLITLYKSMGGLEVL